MLLAAVLARAVRDFVSYSRGRTLAEEQLSEDARRWLFVETDPHSITSFENICMALDLDVESVRRRVLQLKTASAVKTASAEEA